MHAHIDSGNALIAKGFVSSFDWLKWLEKACQFADRWDEGERRMLHTYAPAPVNALADHSETLAFSIGKLRWIMGRVFDASKDEHEEEKDVNA